MIYLNAKVAIQITGMIAVELIQEKMVGLMREIGKMVKGLDMEVVNGQMVIHI